jgi:hypothetical protein
MTVFLAGMRATADRMNDNTLVDSTTSGLTAATNFTASSFSGRKVNGITTVNVVLQYTGGGIGETVGGSGNIAETTAGTLPSGWRPPETVSVLWGSTTNDGRASIATDGTITLSTTSGSSGIATGNSIRITTSWISENG